VRSARVLRRPYHSGWTGSQRARTPGARHGSSNSYALSDVAAFSDAKKVDGKWRPWQRPSRGVHDCQHFRFNDELNWIWTAQQPLSDMKTETAAMPCAAVNAWCAARAEPTRSRSLRRVRWAANTPPEMAVSSAGASYPPRTSRCYSGPRPGRGAVTSSTRHEFDEREVSFLGHLVSQAATTVRACDLPGAGSEPHSALPRRTDALTGILTAARSKRCCARSAHALRASNR
jgi:hypothetical protein